ncbi:MAG: site-specific DNA-methyltransferase [Candidatus Goldbacteria bacterium]|nr:site-specific DNA-methyltransferase [Candidatus Goldiibacteriota bacterium]
MKINVIIQGDCLEVLSGKIDKGTINLVYADPPYNLSGNGLNLTNNKTGGAFYKVNEKWDKWDTDDYFAFSFNWIKGVYEVLKEGGSLYISCSQHNIAEIILNAKRAGFKLNNIITWYKTNAMPNITKRTFTHSTEYVCWFVKGKKWVFNYNEVKKFNPNKTKDGQDKQMRDFLDFIELPVLQGKERIRGSKGRAAHPTQKPERLLELIIKASSNPGDVVLDPFFGTGTTGAVAAKLGRNWIGIEANSKYVKMAEKRLKKNKGE